MIEPREHCLSASGRGQHVRPLVQRTHPLPVLISLVSFTRPPLPSSILSIPSVLRTDTEHQTELVPGVQRVDPPAHATDLIPRTTLPSRKALWALTQRLTSRSFCFSELPLFVSPIV